MHAAEAMYIRAGIPNREKIQFEREHSWNQVNIGTGWLNVDNTHRVFLMSDAQLIAFGRRIGHNGRWRTPTDVESKVVVNFLEEGTRIVLTNQVTLNGRYDRPYSTSPATIPGYKLKYTPVNASGVYGLDPILVNYIYEIDNSQVQVNKQNLQTAIEKAKSMSNSSEYTADYKNKLKNAVITAEEVYVKYTSTQAQVDSAASRLVSSINGLVKVEPKPVEPTPDPEPETPGEPDPQPEEPVTPEPTPEEPADPVNP